MERERERERETQKVGEDFLEHLLLSGRVCVCVYSEIYTFASYTHPIKSTTLCTLEGRQHKTYTNTHTHTLQWFSYHNCR